MEKTYKVDAKLHYNRSISKYLEDLHKFSWVYGPQRVRPSIRSSCQFLENFIVRNSPRGARVLDFGCGTGADSINLAKLGYRVVGIDISEASIKMSILWRQRESVNANFFVTDGEEMALSPSSFDLVFNNGSMSFVDLKRTLKEICRIFRPEGYFVGIDTLGHNPLLNLNRYLNYLKGLRIKKTIRGVLKDKDLELIRRHFHECHLFYFCLLALLSILFKERPWIVSLLQKLDSVLLKVSIIKRYAFKVVFICKRPKNDFSF